jgi:hypothetical protein
VPVKTTLVKFVAKEFNLKHISGSSGDLRGKSIEEAQHIELYGGGHRGVIRYGALSPKFGFENQTALARARSRIIMNEDNFVTDRSPLDNLTYFIAQVGYHEVVTDSVVNNFISQCLFTWHHLTHVVYVKAVQPERNGIEDNKSRIANWYWQKAIDAQFEYWLKNVFMKYQSIQGPRVYVIDYWDLESRKKSLLNFLKP